jgi:hypothetical protein
MIPLWAMTRDDDDQMVLKDQISENEQNMFAILNQCAVMVMQHRRLLNDYQDSRWLFSLFSTMENIAIDSTGYLLIDVLE